MPKASLRPKRSRSIPMYLRLPSPSNNKSWTTRQQSAGRRLRPIWGLDNAATAQSSANKAQSTADQGVATAQAAGAVAVANTVAVQAVNKRVSDLGDYVTVDQAGVYFAEGSYRLTDAGKAALDLTSMDTWSRLQAIPPVPAVRNTTKGSARNGQRSSPSTYVKTPVFLCGESWYPQAMERLIPWPTILTQRGAP